MCSSKERKELIESIFRVNGSFDGPQPGNVVPKYSFQWFIAECVIDISGSKAD